VWPLAAFGGRSAATANAFAALTLLVALLLRVRLRGAVDRGILIVGGLLALQAVPLPRAVVDLLSPQAARVRGSLSLVGGTPGGSLPLSIDTAATVWALAVFAGAVAVFWIARAQLGRGGVRQVTRLIAGLGFALSLLAIAQAATAGRNIYWHFPTEFEGPLPFGPFVNRNHFATWAIMALPLSLGYLAARVSGRPDQPAHLAPRSRLARMIDPRSAWLIAAGAMMAAALLLSLSRSGGFALAASLGLTTAIAGRRLDRSRRRAALAVVAGVALLGLMWADVPALRERFAGAQTGLANRFVIWRETIPIVQDFWLFGTGGGTYEKAMHVYQRSDRTVFFNQAHSHYLQVAAEGGFLLVGALAIAALALVRLARERVTKDGSGLTWIRIGAACGLGAVALQSVWETGLTMPANAALAAVLAAILTCDRQSTVANGEWRVLIDDRSIVN
jgi:O-Antigen ligase